MRRLCNSFRLVFLRTWNANGTSAAVFLYSIADKGIPSVRCIQKGNCSSFHQISFNRYFKIFSVYQFRMLAHHNWQMRVHECSSLHRLSAEPGKSSQAATFLFMTCLNLLAPELIFFLILAHPVYKMWIKREPNTLELWNELHFEEEKKRRVYNMFKIFGTYICWINI